MCFWHHAFLTFTCSKSTIETLEQGVKSVQSQPIKHQKDAKQRRSADFIINFVLASF